MDDNEMVTVDPSPNLEAFSQYYDLFCVKDEDRMELVNQTKAHLSALGWTFYKNSEELRYKSPAGRSFGSLIDAVSYAHTQRKAAGTMVDPCELCDMTVTNHDVLVKRCIACRCKFCRDLQETCSENPKLKCYSCQKFYHVPCRFPVRPLTDSFCSDKCHELYYKLKDNSRILKPVEGTNYRWGFWRVYSDENEVSKQVTKKKLEEALQVMDPFFRGIPHPWSENRDLVRDTVLGENSKKQNFLYGFFAACLELNGEILSVILVRVLGSKLAEIPFAATKSEYQGKGVLTKLLTVVEATLAGFKVRKIIIPSVEEKIATWKHLGYTELGPWDMYKVGVYRFLNFSDTTLLQKVLNHT